jgi:hypothetical protein
MTRCGGSAQCRWVACCAEVIEYAFGCLSIGVQGYPRLSPEICAGHRRSVVGGRQFDLRLSGKEVIE